MAHLRHCLQQNTNRRVCVHRSVYDTKTLDDGEQTRSFCHIDGCVRGTYRLMQSDYRERPKLGGDRIVTITERAESLVPISGKSGIRFRHIDGPIDVRGRNSENGELRRVLGWEPSISLEGGLIFTYRWIEQHVRERDAVGAPIAVAA